MIDSDQLPDFVAAAIILGFTLFYIGMEFTGESVNTGVSFGLQVLGAVMVLVALFHLFGDAVPLALDSLSDVRSSDDEDDDQGGEGR